MTVEDDTFIHNKLGHAVGHIFGVFYAYNGLLGSRDPGWIQGTINFLIGLLRRIGLIANIVRSKMMTCHPGVIQLVMSEETMGRQITGKGSTYR